MASLPSDVGQLLCSEFDAFVARGDSPAEWEELQARLWRWFQSLDEPLAFEGMLWVFEHSDRYQHQLLAGELLARRRVPLLIPPADFLRRIAPRLNASAREIVHYLATEAGLEVARREVQSITRAATDQRMQAGLRSAAYWLALKEAEQPPGVTAPNGGG